MLEAALASAPQAPVGAQPPLPASSASPPKSGIMLLLPELPRMDEYSKQLLHLSWCAQLPQLLRAEVDRFRLTCATCTLLKDSLPIFLPHMGSATLPRHSTAR